MGKYRDLEAGIRWMENIASDDSHGYSQTNRYGPSWDCSSFVAFALIISGFDIRYNSTTYDLKDQLLRNGWKSLRGEPRQRGDILLNETHHVVMCVDANSIVHASGTVKGILKEAYYRPSFGYPVHMRWTSTIEKLSLHDIALEVIAGKWGNYPERKQLLENAGYIYDYVQREVDSILGGYKG